LKVALNTEVLFKFNDIIYELDSFLKIFYS